MPSWKLVLICMAVTSLVWGQTPTPPANSESSTARLPVTRVILYKNGVGYFEHAGHIRGNQDVNIDFTTAQLNDVLKSLTVLDLGKGHITGVSYNSIAPLERRLGSLRLPVGENPSTPQFLSALRGARMEVRSGETSASGRLLSIDERQLPTKGEEKVTTYQISIVSDAGDVRVFDLNPATSVRLMEKDVNEEVGKYLGLVASSRDADVRRMAISTAGDGDRNLLVSYISEVPVWKSTYRLVIPQEGKPLLQGWAIVDNTIGEDWKDVELSLVAGAPQSFVEELSQPYYTRRPVVPLPENAMLTPQTHEATVEEMEAPSVSASGSASLVTPSRIPEKVPAVIGGVAGGVPGGQMGGVIGGIVASTPVAVPRLNATEAVQSLEAVTTVAQTQDLGDLFEYKLKDHVTIRKNQSALVPILQSRIDAEKVSVWNPSESSALRAFWIDNTSGLTLDGGSFNVLEGDAFAGEGLMDAIKPGEKRLLSYAADLGLVVDAKQKSEKQKVTKVVIAHGTMTQVSEEREERTYNVRNRDASARTLIIEHPVRSGWKLVNGPEPVETSASFERFRVNVEPKKTATLIVQEYRPISTRYQISSITDGQIEFFLGQNAINSEVDKALHRVTKQKSAIADLDADITSRKTQIASIAEDQQRVRENMKALKGSAEEKTLVQRYAQKLNSQEDRIQLLQREMSDLKQKRDTSQKSLDEMIESLKLESTI